MEAKSSCRLKELPFTLLFKINFFRVLISTRLTVFSPSSLFVRCCAASIPEAGKAPHQSHASHTGSQGGHEGQPLAYRKSSLASPCCAQICANQLNFVPDNRLRVTRHSWCTSLKSPDKPHCEDQKCRTQLQRCPYELYSHTRQKTSQTEVSKFQCQA